MKQKLIKAALSAALLFSSAPALNCLQPIAILAESQNEIVSAGYSSIASDRLLNNLARKVYGENGSWKTPVTDSRAKTFYAAFRLDPANQSEENYIVTFTKGNGSYSQSLKAEDGGLAYFSLEEDHGSLSSDDLKGTYTITLSKEGEDTPLASKDLNLYEVTIKAGEGCEGPDRIVYLDDRSLEGMKNVRPHEYVFTGEANNLEGKPDGKRWLYYYCYCLSLQR